MKKGLLKLNSLVAVSALLGSVIVGWIGFFEYRDQVRIAELRNESILRYSISGLAPNLIEVTPIKFVVSNLPWVILIYLATYYIVKFLFYIAKFFYKRRKPDEPVFTDTNPSPIIAEPAQWQVPLRFIPLTFIIFLTLSFLGFAHYFLYTESGVFRLIDLGWALLYVLPVAILLTAFVHFKIWKVLLGTTVCLSLIALGTFSFCSGECYAIFGLVFLVFYLLWAVVIGLICRFTIKFLYYLFKRNKFIAIFILLVLVGGLFLWVLNIFKYAQQKQIIHEIALEKGAYNNSINDQFNQDFANLGTSYTEAIDFCDKFQIEYPDFANNCWVRLIDMRNDPSRFPDVKTQDIIRACEKSINNLCEHFNVGFVIATEVQEITSLNDLITYCDSLEIERTDMNKDYFVEECYSWAILKNYEKKLKFNIPENFIQNTCGTFSEQTPLYVSLFKACRWN